jgi:2,7-dihydroxy-5-methyl-1-naphthoate 7-O-methyltransferase
MSGHEPGPAPVTEDVRESPAGDAVDPRRLLDMCDLLTPWALRTAATLRLADHVASGHTTPASLADAAGCDPAALSSLLRFLCTRGLFTEPEPDVFRLTAMGDALRDEHPRGLRRWLDLDCGVGRLDLTFSRLIDSVRTGEPAYHLVFGRSFWEDLDADPEIRRATDEVWDARLDHQAEQVAAAYDWSRAAHLVDVGGGSGIQLQAILARAPHLRATLVDRRPVADATERLRGAGLADRASVVSGSFFDELPAGADTCLLSEVLHNWSDADAERILRRCADAVAAQGRVLIVEAVAEDRHDPHLTRQALLMLVSFGGRERCLDDWRALAGRCGLSVAEVMATGSGASIIECVPAGG